METNRIFTFFVLAILSVLGFVVNSTTTNPISAAESSLAAPAFGHTFALTKTIPLFAENFWNVNDAYFDKVTNHLYYVARISDKAALIQVNFNNGGVTRLKSFEAAGFLAMSPNGRYLYYAEYPISNPFKVHVYDTVAKQVIRTFKYDSNLTDFIATDDNRLFVLTLSSLDMVDGTTGALLKSISIPGAHSYGRTFALSPDQKTLFMIANYKIFKFDISQGDLNELLHKQEAQDYRSISISSDGSYLIVTPIYGQWLYRFNTQTLTLIDTYTYSQDSSNFTEDVRGSRNSNTFYGLWHGVLQEIDITTNQPIREVKGDSLYYGGAVIPINNNRVALLYSDHIELFAPTSHGVALPSVMNNYCAVSINDDFSSPSSGWPVGVSGSTTYRYISGEYSMLFADANRWAAATPGHVWNNGELLRVEGSIVDNRKGSYGLLYGLNNDWSDFYTFEVYPQYQGWAIFHYEQAKGWKLVTSNTSNRISVTGKNTLEIKSSSSEEMRFYVNKESVHSSEQRGGRIGLTGTSLVRNVDIRFDNYVFANENCPVPTQFLGANAAAVNSFSLERPSFETFPSDH